MTEESKDMFIFRAFAREMSVLMVIIHFQLWIMTMGRKDVA